HRVLREQVRRGRVHPGARRRARGRGRGDPADPRRDAHRVLRRPGREVPAGPGRDAQPAGGRRGRDRLRARPAAVLPGEGAGRLPGHGDLIALTAHRTAPAATAPVRAAARGRPVLLALRGLGLGDLLTAVPALRALRRAHPGHRFVLAAPARLAGLLPLIGGVDELLDVSGPGPVPWRGPDVAVNLHGSGPQSTLALCRTRPGRLLTHAHPGIPGVAGPPWREEMHEVRRWCAQLAWYGIPADPGDLALRDPGRSPLRGGEIVIHPGAASGARRWPPERFAEVAAELGRLGHPIVVTGGTAEIGIARRVAR